MRISKDEVVTVANLARLELNEASLDRFAKQIGNILEYVDTLNGIDTEGITPTSHAIPLTNAFREDQAVETFDRERALSNAPENDDENFIVPRVVG